MAKSKSKKTEEGDETGSCKTNVRGRVGQTRRDTKGVKIRRQPAYFCPPSETEMFSEGPGKYIQIQTWLRNCLEYVTLTSRNLRNKHPRQTTRNKQLARSFSQRRFHLHVAKKTSTT